MTECEFPSNLLAQYNFPNNSFVDDVSTKTSSLTTTTNTNNVNNHHQQTSRDPEMLSMASSCSNSSSYYLTSSSLSTTIKIENLSYFCESQHLQEHFERYAQVKELLITRDKDTQKRIALISFECVTVARSMVRMFNGSWFLGRKLM